MRLESALAALRTSIQHRGAVGTVSRILADPIYRLRDRRFDRRFNVRTAGIVLPADLDIQEAHKRTAVQYQPVRLHAFAAIMQALPIHHPEFTFVDFGCGKGKAVLLASEFPFRHIIGVEISPALCAIARENLENYNSPTRKCYAVDIVCEDAAICRLPPEPAILFFYNPFTAAIMNSVMANLADSLRIQPRSVYVVLYNPVLEDIASRNSFLRPLIRTGQFSIYQSR